VAAVIVLVLSRVVAHSDANPLAPLQLNPDNPHYLLFRGRPTVLVGSSEHYGSVLNLDFDYLQYLDTLRASGLNATRIFTGAYRELPGKFAPGWNFEIVHNTLAPTEDGFISPWLRTGNRKFDLTQWDSHYFERLKDFVAQASRRGIVVEVSLFSTFYGDKAWNASPLNSKNNINSIGDVPREDVLTMKDSALLGVEAAMVRKVVGELEDFDNVYYEICNEPFLGRVPVEWQKYIAQTIEDTEAGLTAPHLIAQEFDNAPQTIKSAVPQASLFLFHDTRTPTHVTLNYQLGKPIGINENGVDGIDAAPYRIQAWQYLMAGGAVAIGLDYSFTTDHPDGTFTVPRAQPGGGNEELRRELGILLAFMDGLEIPSMVPDSRVVVAGVPSGTSVYALSNPGRIYAVYFHHGRIVKPAPTDFSIPGFVTDNKLRHLAIAVQVPAGPYTAQWISTKTGVVENEKTLNVVRGRAHLKSPTYSQDIALLIRATPPKPPSRH
jgi:hypothetical protein